MMRTSSRRSTRSTGSSNPGHSAGLFNLGNTCYMNSTLQCLHSVPELKSSLSSYTNSGRNNELDQQSHLLTVATRDLFNELDLNVRPVAPLQFLSIMRKKFPQFAQQHNGGYMQQDAEECWSQLMYTLSQTLRATDSSEASGIVKTLFGIGFVNRVYCAETNEESFENESVYALKCHISQETNHLHEGLRRGLRSEFEKTSSSLERTAVFTKESHISELPRYLTVQFVRFFWKRETNQKAKILRKVDFPLELDVYEFCSSELRRKLQAPRQTLRELENVKFGLKVEDKTRDNQVNLPKSEEASNDSREPSDENAAFAGEKGQLSGIYDLVAVLTHKGRSADSGHYVAWVKQENGKWILYDDDNPIPQREEDIKLSGGGDWHMAYICMYKARVV